MKKKIALLAATIVALTGGTAYAIASDVELDTLVGQIHASEVACEDAREYADAVTRANTRTLFRAVIIPVIDSTTLAQAKERANYALNVLAAPGPAESASKTIHAINRQMGAECIQGLRSAQARASALKE